MGKMIMCEKEDICICMHVCEAASVVYDLLQSYGLQLLCPWDSLGKNTGVSCHAFLQGIFLTQGLNHVSWISCISRGIFTTKAIWGAQYMYT